MDPTVLRPLPSPFPVWMPYGADIRGHEIIITMPKTLRSKMRPVARLANFGTPSEQAWAQYLIKELAQKLGIYPASIHSLYGAMARGDLPKQFTVPAMNLRAMTFDLAEAAFRQALEIDAAAIIFELARTEMSYTGQSPQQYTATVFAAAIAAGWTGPVFVQGDHFQVSAAKFTENPQKEIGAVEELIREAIAAWFFNIDVDTSTLVDLSRRTLREQQYNNARWTAHFLELIRSLQPEGVTISVGGEIGEVGGKNSTTRELVAYLKVLALILGRIPDLSKASINTGTAHGGTTLPDGSTASVKLDTRAMRLVGQRARRQFGMIIVQHGASTLPPEAFSIIRMAEAGECHLASAIMRSVFRNVTLGMDRRMREALTALKGGPKEGQTEEQWWKDNAKHVLAQFSSELWGMSELNRRAAVDEVEAQFATIFDAFNIAGTRPLVEQYAPPPAQPFPNPRPDEVDIAVTTTANIDTTGLSD